MRLFIAEKPSVAAAIADALGGGKKGSGFYDLPSVDTKVTWCYGHLLEQAQPEYYVEGGKVLPNHLPVIPDVFKLSPRPKAADQVKVIKSLLKEANEVVNAGDADREGQLLVDELFPVLGWNGKTSRLWLSSLDAESVKLALAKIKSNSDYSRIYDSALARQRADWLISLNASIALSRNLQAMGEQGAWSVGRVQTPTLALITDRDAAIKNFTKQNHYLLEITLDGIVARWSIPEEFLNEQGLLLKEEIAQQLCLELVGATLVVSEFACKPGTRSAPMPFTLGTLQAATSRLLGLSAAQTLAAAQTLYEAKLTTYPRTDCAYLPLEMFSKANQILTDLGLIGEGIDPKRQHVAWNTSKVEAHHGIIPTGVVTKGANLDSNTIKVFELIKKSFAQLFMEPESFEVRQAKFTLDNDPSKVFLAKSRTVLVAGWSGSESDEQQEDGDSTSFSQLPDLEKGRALLCNKAEVLSKETAPLKHYTDGTLIAAMKSVHKYIDDPKLKERLKETSGLGTEATRAAMLEALISKGYVERKGKNLIATLKGTQLISWLRKDVGTATFAQAATTALQEDALADIAMGRLTLDAFLSSVKDTARLLCSALLNANFIDLATLTFNVCPACHGAKCILRTSKSGGTYHACAECCARFADDSGKPGKQFEDLPKSSSSSSKANLKGPNCDQCNKPTASLKTRADKTYFRCMSCGISWWPGYKNSKELGSKWPLREGVANQ
ncbi:DNA topoisomerase III [Polynucleobacter sp. 86C-FISCH]|uniref:DNA topoisomerase n=1 Tax=Polynucleobacter sp. 86C-FISCH TaxID=2689101 RepID=UPI001C0C503B|nr:DNA topoisomerase [Polynucleobacter sp. 86C-FISCH]MBU3595099.1 DNA topoisomerase III [Polynucleobacter sp. 86C-FISCH]